MSIPVLKYDCVDADDLYLVRMEEDQWDAEPAITSQCPYLTRLLRRSLVPGLVASKSTLTNGLHETGRCSHLYGGVNPRLPRLPCLQWTDFDLELHLAYPTCCRLSCIQLNIWPCYLRIQAIGYLLMGFLVLCIMFSDQ